MAEPDPPVVLDDEVADLLRPRPHERLLRALDHRRADPTAWRRTAALAVTGVAGAAALWWLLRPPAPPIESSIPRASATAVTDAGGPAGAAGSGGSPGPGGAAPAGADATDTTGPDAEVVVQAAGAVARPGVYRMTSGGRVDDLVRRAGGVTPDADVDRVNLAAPLSDGERVWIPRRGEPEPPPVVAGAGGGGVGAGRSEGPGAGEPGDGPADVVDLNTATAEQLDALPGVGPATAAAILAYRDANGPFRSVDDLLEVRGIGDAKLEQLRPLVRV